MPPLWALAGVNLLVLISSVAKTAGVGDVVYTSIFKGADSPLQLARNHIATEEALAAGGDFAEAIAVVALTRSEQRGVQELAGDGGFTLAQMPADVSKAAGKAIPYANMPKETYAGILQGIGLPDAMAEAVADSDDHGPRGALQDEGRSLSRLIGRPTAPMAVAVRAALAG